MTALLLLLVAGTPADTVSETASGQQTQTVPSLPVPTPETTPADIVINVDGMVCSFCVQGVERTMERIEGVDSVALSLESKTISLWMKTGGHVTDEFLRKQIKASGFDAREIVRAEPQPVPATN